MTNPILKLFFDFKGSLSKQQYLVVLVLLLVLVSIGNSQTVAYYLSNFTVALIGFEAIAFHSVFMLFFDDLPSLLPVHFLVLYGALSLTVKRSRTLHLNTLATTILAIINYCFFVTLLNWISIAIYITESIEYYREFTYLVTPESVLYIACLLFTIGLLANIYLIAKTADENDRSILSTSGLRIFNQFQYAIFIGKILFIHAILMFALPLILYFNINDISYLTNSIGFIISLTAYHLALVGFYIYALEKRIKDAGFPIFYLMLAIVFVFLILAYILYIILLSDKKPALVIAFTPFIFTLIGALQIIPFLLQSKSKNKIEDN